MAADDNKLERLTNLILLLLDAPRPIPLSEIATQVPGYPEEKDARRQAIERDKKLLREEGIIVESVPIAGDEQYGYRIDPTTYFLPDLDLTTEEAAALNLAVAGVHMGNDSGGDALRKLGVAELADVQPVALMEDAQGLDRLYQAIASKAEVRFSYLGEQRSVAPIQIRFAGGHWYLAGWSKERDAGRNFRVDRIDGTVTIGAPGTGVVDDDKMISLELPDEPWGFEGGVDPSTTLLLWVDSLYAWRVVNEVGFDKITERRPDGSVVLSVDVVRDEIARSWVLSFLDHVEVLEPASFRSSLISWLQGIRDAPKPSGPVPSRSDLESPDSPAESPKALPPAQRRLRRLLAMLEWLASEGSASTEEVAARFDMTPDEVVGELQLAACCGRPPYSPGELMDIIVDADEVIARLPELERTRSLSAAEGVAIAAAAQMILNMPGADQEGPLGRALGKLEAALGRLSAVQVRLESPPLLQQITEAAESRRQLEVEYLATSNDELTVRTIDPLRVAALEGRWYVIAFCHRADALRTFRVDSFKSVKDIGAQPVHEEVPDLDSETFTVNADAIEVMVRVAPSARWVADSIPVLARVVNDQGEATVAISVSGQRWFERVLLQAGLDVTVLAPEEMVGSASSAAERVLRRYQPTV
jgi:proteasome accessory factor C